MDWQSRTEALVGADTLECLRHTSVAVFGVGGVGSWCAEALVRSGVGHLTLVDPDCVDATNINRQLPALHSTVGRPKVDVMRERLLDINPEADIVARQERYRAATSDSFSLQEYDYVVDAIDSVADKMELILAACGPSTLLSSMGAARRMDPLQVRVTEFWKVDGCPLAAKLRKRMRKAQRFPARKFKCVWSAELPKEGGDKGSMMPVTAAFGLTLASLVLKG